MPEIALVRRCAGCVSPVQRNVSWRGGKSSSDWAEGVERSDDPVQ